MMPKQKPILAKNSLALSATEADRLKLSYGKYTFDPNSDNWTLSRNHPVTLAFLKDIDPSQAEFFRMVLRDSAINSPSSTADGHISVVRNYFNFTEQNVFTLESFFKWKECDETRSSKTNHKQAQLLRNLILNGAEQGYHGIPDVVVQTLRDIKLTQHRDVAIPCVEAMDIHDGPFTDYEIQGVIATALKAYSENRLNLKRYALLLTIAYTGRRPIQIIDLKVKDLLSEQGDDHVKRFYLNIPRAKQRGQKFRSAFNVARIPEELWLLLRLQIDGVTRCFEKACGRSLPEKVLNDLPLFFSSHALVQKNNLSQITSLIGSDVYHMKSSSLNNEFEAMQRILNVTSERTGGQLHLTPYRFRHTFGTNAAREGAGVSVIAEILDHTTNVVAGSYVKNNLEIVDRLDKALAFQLAPFAQAFAGVIVRSEYEAERGKDPRSRVSNGKSNLGSCGSYGFCGSVAPIACYTCQHFQPWLDGPHQQVLDSMIEERERLKEVTGDLRIASVNDRVIFAVSEVIQRCENMRSKQAALPDG